MGYACPVCAAPQADAEHLANHLAFSALLHGDDHERWLDEHVSDWSARGPEALAPTVASEADEIDLPADESVPEPESDRWTDTPPESQHPAPPTSAVGSTQPQPAHDEEISRVLAEARELTERRQGGDEDGNADGDGDTGSAGDDGNA